MIPELTPDDYTRPCIAASLDDEREFTVASYDAVQRQRELQPIWARQAPAVEDLTLEPHYPYDIRIVDEAAYRAQMWQLVGLAPDPAGT